jgi:hypothetical protein
MGVTIRYHGVLDDPAQLDAALAMLREECAQRGWPCEELDIEARGPHETYTFRDVPGPLPGLMMFDERDARLMMLYSHGEESNSVMYSLSVKTQFAPPEIHVAICEVLRRLQDEFGRQKFIVSDGSGYFDTQDMDALLKMRGVIEEAMQNTELISHIVQLGTIGDRAAPPGESELRERRN